jgi:hypothetical protein
MPKDVVGLSRSGWLGDPVCGFRHRPVTPGGDKRMGSIHAESSLKPFIVLSNCSAAPAMSSS